mgnify:CR=1 FL=1
MKVLQWCRANAMPVIAVLAAAVTAVFVPLDSAYLGYYDVKTLSCLFCILAVVCALRGAGLFPLLAQRLVRAFHTAGSAVTAGIPNSAAFTSGEARAVSRPTRQPYL